MIVVWLKIAFFVVAGVGELALGAMAGWQVREIIRNLRAPRG